MWRWRHADGAERGVEGAGGGAGAGAGGNVKGSVGEEGANEPTRASRSSESGRTGVASEGGHDAGGRDEAAEAEKEAIDGIIARLSVPAPPAGLHHLPRVPASTAAGRDRAVDEKTNDRAVDAAEQRERWGAFPLPGEFAAAAAGGGLDDEEAGGVRRGNPPDSGVGMCV